MYADCRHDGLQYRAGRPVRASLKRCPHCAHFFWVRFAIDENIDETCGKSMTTRPKEVHIRYLQREVRLPGLRTAGQIRDAAEILVASGWLYPSVANTRFGPRARLAYFVNPRLWSDTAEQARCGTSAVERSQDW
jgi:hypothetical protein